MQKLRVFFVFGVSELLDTMASTSNFTKDEIHQLRELRLRVNQIYSESDEVLISWLRARDHDVDRAEQMLRRHLIWRNNNEVDKLRSWKSPKCYFPVLQSGFDKEGYPIFLLPIGKWELRASIENGDIVPALRYIYQYLDKVVTTCRQANVNQGITILDFDGFGYRQIAHRTVIQGILEVLRVFEANYPETLKHAIVINAPKVFNILFALIKPLLHSRTLAKVMIFNSDKRKWQDALWKLMTPDQLPPYWGGTKSGLDECCSEAWLHEPLPKYFMRKIGSYSDEYGDEWLQIRVAAGETVTLEYEMEGRLDSSLRWAFTTESYDIGFSLEYIAKEKTEYTSESIISMQRRDAHLEKQEGKLQLDKPGKYIITFDNTYSRTRAKNLNYSVTLTQIDPSMLKNMRNKGIEISNNNISNLHNISQIVI